MRKLKTFIFALVLFLAGFVTKTLSAALPDQVEIEIDYLFVDDKTTQASLSFEKDYGSILELNAPEIDDYEFLYWIVNGSIRENLGASSKIVVQSQTKLIGVYKPIDKIAVIFIDSNGSLIDYETLDSGSQATAPSTVSFSKPGAIPNEFVSINNQSLENIEEDTVFYLTYTTDLAGGTLTVDGVLEVEDRTLNDVVSLSGKAPEGFKYWVDENEQILSDNPNYSFTMLGFNRVINSVVDKQTPEHIVNMTQDLQLRENYQTFVGQFNGNPTEFGFLISKESKQIVSRDQENVVVAQAKTLNQLTNEYTFSFPKDYKSIVAYAVYADEVVLSEYSFYEELVDFKIANLPENMVVFENEELDLRNLEMKAFYRLAEARNVDVEELIISGFDNTTLGKQTITLTLEEGNVSKSASFNVYVAQSDVIYYQDYSNYLGSVITNQDNPIPKTRIEIQDSANATLTITEEGIKIDSTQNMYSINIMALEEEITADSYLIEAEVSYSDFANTTRWAGIVFAQTEYVGYYVFSLRPNGTPGVSRREADESNGSLVSGGSWPGGGLPAFSAVGFTPNIKYKLSVLVNEGEAKFYIDDVYQSSFTFHEGYVGNGVGLASGGMDATLHNLKIKEVESQLELETHLTKLELTNLPDNMVVYENEELDLEDIIVKAHYGLGNTIDVDVEELTISGFDKTTLGKQTVTLTLEEGNVSKSASFNVHVAQSDVIYYQDYSNYLGSVITNQDNPIPKTRIEIQDSAKATLTITEEGLNIDSTLNSTSINIMALEDQISAESYLIEAEVSYSDFANTTRWAGIVFAQTEYVGYYSFNLRPNGIPNIGRRIVHETNGSLVSGGSWQGGGVPAFSAVGFTPNTKYKFSVLVNQGEAHFYIDDTYQNTFTFHEGFVGGGVGFASAGMNTTLHSLKIKEMESQLELETHLTKLELTNLPDNMVVYENEELDLEDIIVKAHYGLGNTIDVDIEELTISGFDNTTLGKQTVTLTLEEGNVNKSASFNVYVAQSDVIYYQDYSNYLGSVITNQNNPIPKTRIEIQDSAKATLTITEEGLNIDSTLNGTAINIMALEDEISAESYLIEAEVSYSDFTNATRWAGVVFAQTDYVGYYVFTLRPNGTPSVLKRVADESNGSLVSGGTWEGGGLPAFSAVGFTPNTKYKLSILVNQGKVDLFIDNVYQSSFRLHEGFIGDGVGFASGGMNTTLHNFKVKEVNPNDYK